VPPSWRVVRITWSVSGSRAKTAPTDLGGRRAAAEADRRIPPKLEESVERSRVRIRADVVD